MLEIEDLAVRYGRVIAVDRVSFGVTPGQVSLVLGSNGAGKSSTLLALAGMVRGRSGSVRLEGEEISRLPAQRRVGRGLVLVPEGRRIFGNLTVLENLRMGAMTAPRAYTQPGIEQVLSLFPHLAERAQGKAGLLSGGEQQMLAIGRALMSRPKYVMMDEPSMGLAPVMVDSVLESVRRIADDGVGVLMIEQNAEAGAEIADHIAVMARGQIVHQGPKGSVASEREVLRAMLGEAALG